MAFKTIRQPVNNDSGDSDRTKVDWDALNKYVVETANLQQRESLLGYISGIVDLGVQPQADSEVEFNGSEQDEADEIDDNPGTYFKDGKNEKGKDVRLKCWKNKPVQSVAVCVDFPDIMLNKGQFFGEEKAEEKPLRLWLGGQFYTKEHGMVIGKVIPLREGNIAPHGSKAVWSFKPNHTLYKLALGAKIVQPGEPFKPENIDSLLGKTLQWEAQVFFKKGNNGKEYYTEYLKYVGAPGRGQKDLELVTEPFVVQFDENNSQESVKELRSHVINTIRMAENFSGSKIEKQLEQYRGNDKPAEDAPKESSAPAAKTVPQKAPKPKLAPLPPVDSDYDDDIPF